MYFKFECPHCHKSLKVGEEKAGQRARCPYCHNAVQVPDPPAPQPPADQPPAPEDALAAIAAAASDVPTAVARPRRHDGGLLAAGAPSSAPSPFTATTATHTTPATSASASTTASPSTKASSASSSANAASEGTNVGMFTTAGLGLVMTAIWYGILYPMQGSRLADLFYARGWVTVAEALLFFWCVAIFIFKIRKLRRQKESMLFDLLPNEISDEIAIRNVHEFSRNVRSLPVKPGESFLVNRVLRGLEHFAIRRSTPEVGTLLSSQSDIDANAVSSSYTLLKVFIWAIPILGFIGTVQGLGDSVGAFGGSIENANDIAALKGSLSSIIAGLAVAFDTTLVALIMSVPLTYFASSMQKSEEDLLNWVDEYTNENLLKRLADGAGGTPVALDSKQALRAAIDAAMADHHAELEAWNRKLQNIGSNITTQVIDGWSGMLADLRSVQDQLTTTRQTQLADHQQTAAQLQQALAALSDRAHHIEAQTTTSLQQTAASMQTQFAAMEQALSSLNRVLTELGEKQIVIQKEAPRRGWFSRK